ncbi:MAG TPA: DUF5668 domain-containing protein [Bacteroidota bacterium]|jgi:hypothetical protein
MFRTRVSKTLIGSALVICGLLLILMNMEAIPSVSLWRYWPAFLIIIGIAKLGDESERGAVMDGTTWIVWGLWFFACSFNWFGFTYSNSWPVLLIAGGITMVWKSLLPKNPHEQEKLRSSSLN